MKHKWNLLLIVIFSITLMACGEKKTADVNWTEEEKEAIQTPTVSVVTEAGTVSYVQKSEQRVEAAKQKLEAGMEKEYINLLNEALEINPKNEEALFLCAKACMDGIGSAVNYRKAVYYYNQLLQKGFDDFGDWKIRFEEAKTLMEDFPEFISYDPESEDGYPSWSQLRVDGEDMILFIRLLLCNEIVERYCAEEFLAKWEPLDEKVREQILKHNPGYDMQINRKQDRIYEYKMEMATTNVAYEFTITVKEPEGITDITWEERELLQ